MKRKRPQRPAKLSAGLPAVAPEPVDSDANDRPPLVLPGPNTSSAIAPTDTILVLTADRLDHILAAGGSGDWVLNIDKAARHRYLVCCRKSRWDNKAEGTADRAAFLVGIIRDFVRRGPSNRSGQHRFQIALSHFALVEKAGVWDPTWRNPVGYVSLKNLGIDPQRFDFKPLEAKPDAALDAPPLAAPQRLTLAEAKKALAETFGVRPEDIEINIRG
jgi:hypothetical protein